jgi:hypothetical protein
MTSGIEQITVHCQREKMQIQPSNNWIKAADAESPLGNQPRRVKPTDSVINELGSGFESFVRTALRTDELNPEAVTAAKKAISDGTLDTPETHQLAAKKLLSFGF